MDKIFEVLKKLDQKPIYNKYDKEINSINVKINIQPIVKFYKVAIYKEGKIINTFFFKRIDSVIDFLKSNLYSFINYTEILYNQQGD